MRFPPLSDALCAALHQDILFDPYGEFGGPQPTLSKKQPVKILSRVEELKVLSSLADTGLLSSLESSGTFSKLERAGAFSAAEKLLPLADDLKLLSVANALLNLPAFYLTVGAGVIVAGGASRPSFFPPLLARVAIACPQQPSEPNPSHPRYLSYHRGRPYLGPAGRRAV